MDEKILELGNERVRAEYNRRASDRKDIKKIVKLVLVPQERVFYDYYPFSFHFRKEYITQSTVHFFCLLIRTLCNSDLSSLF